MKTWQWSLAHGRSLELGRDARIMGILNVTPDSFADGGRFTDHERAIEHAGWMIAQGAAIIDIGGESTRPGAEPISVDEELRRVLPLVEALAGQNVLLSVDTYRAETARRAIAAGAHIVNDVWGAQRDPGIARVAAEFGAGLVLMHTGRGRRKAPDVIEDQYGFLERSLAIAREAGVAPASIVLDPGFGFAKEIPAENLELIARFGELHGLGFPFLVGTSRKRFLGHVTGRAVADRDAATAATSVALRLRGAALFRVHDVAINRDALAIADAIVAHENPGHHEAGHEK